MTSCILRNDALRVEILPEAGGGVLRFDALRGEERVPVFRPGTAEAALREPKTLGCYLLVPWSNRIGHGQFPFGGNTVHVPRTRNDEPYPLHGHGWLQPWQLVQASHEAAELVCLHDDAEPFFYTATLRYALRDTSLHIALTVRNEGSSLPFGLGLHPFLPRTADVRLHAPATGMWRAGPDHLPLALEALPDAADFRESRTLAADVAINHGFEGWPGQAQIVWPARGLALDIAAETSRYVLYTPVAQDVFCFEPVDHPINAHNLPGAVQDHGLTVLDTGQSLRRHFQFTVHNL
jgi:aldose 1-epimerase